MSERDQWTELAERLWNEWRGRSDSGAGLRLAVAAELRKQDQRIERLEGALKKITGPSAFAMSLGGRDVIVCARSIWDAARAALEK